MAAFTLRPYQQEAVDQTIAFMTVSRSSCLLDLCTGAGKSIIVSEIAKWISEASGGKKILCLQPSKELCEQNYQAWLETGAPASVWCAGLGRKEMRHNVVFATPMSVKKSLTKFTSGDFCAVIVDEAHKFKGAQLDIIEPMREASPNLRLLGLTGTPYRLGDGLIYKTYPDGSPVGDDACKEPYYDRLIMRVGTQELIDLGYLTKPVFDHSHIEIGDGSEARAGWNRETSQIVREIVTVGKHRKGVMLFGSSLEHCEEICDSLPEGDYRMVSADTPKKEREKLINDFKLKKFKYLVNKDILTTGFNAVHVDLIAILRATESRSLFQQIIGRGLRLCEGKEDVLIMDYAENIENHGLTEDSLFEPEIKANWRTGESFMVEAQCESCGGVNDFSGRPNPDNLEYDAQGYFTDLAGSRIEISEGVFMPGHYGRRCNHHQLINGDLVRCNGRWSMKVCPECEAENDIAARKCTECKAELIDPNEKLRLDYKKMKGSPRILSTDEVRSWNAREWTSQRGNKCLRVTFTTDYRTFDAYYFSESSNAKMQGLWRDLCMAVFGKVAPNEGLFVQALKNGFGAMPRTITSKKEGDFFRVYSHNLPVDEKPKGA